MMGLMVFSGIIGVTLMLSLACGGAAPPAATTAPAATVRPAATTPPAAATQPPAAVACAADARVIGPVGETLKFDKEKLTAKAGSAVTVCFKNISTVNQHNWVLVKQGTKDTVAVAGIAAAATGYVPVSPDVLAKTALVNAGQNGVATFTAPAAGKYQYVCTFPGHNATMFGEFEATTP